MMDLGQFQFAVCLLQFLAYPELGISESKIIGYRSPFLTMIQ